jgi:hypothetical protein
MTRKPRRASFEKIPESIIKPRAQQRVTLSTRALNELEFNSTIRADVRSFNYSGELSLKRAISAAREKARDAKRPANRSNLMGLCSDGVTSACHVTVS